ncbi:hypothetical protein FLJC2902T_20800 [Flavobacterium limnosediminis JC2902]|uniref:Secretion system C-terminal sorting domain-containing protein n=1 Tax=Flavobacterium limnosediminis JC2902 TaxID=1341181 RepID=V6SSG8_9FLAO|nr:T9SS type A sorting domain-containing protein [Flavobacterium limnosediminis]ESU27375.1 hypothetical protein FLJC2902T_20800 [Flavobacterium limnosediminis JC2902]
MKKTILFFVLFLSLYDLKAQQLNVPQVIQEQNQWCWAGVSKSILNYYGTNVSQCQIADYARQVISWNNFGSVNCCTNPNLGCNYWNYAWGYSGSIQDILVHFSNIQNYGYSNALSLSQISTQIGAGRPFVVRWGWVSGGGHFVVGHGINGSNISYMDPWFGEGYHISTYSWLVNDGNHNWTHTNILTTNLSTGENQVSDFELYVYPNPAQNEVTIKGADIIEDVKMYDVAGKLIKHLNHNPTDNNVSFDVSDCETGLYFFEIQIGGKKYLKEIAID